MSCAPVRTMKSSHLRRAKKRPSPQQVMALVASVNSRRVTSPLLVGVANNRRGNSNSRALACLTTRQRRCGGGALQDRFHRNLTVHVQTIPVNIYRMVGGDTIARERKIAAAGRFNHHYEPNSHVMRESSMRTNALLTI